MKNRYDYLKAKFATWTKLKNKTVIMSNKYVEALRSTPLPYPEICIHLFEGSTSNGFDSWGPSSTLPHPVEEVSDHNLNNLESIECTQIEPPTQGFSEETSGRSKKKRRKTKS
ncbi:hypothetical protein R6Q59_024022 [Mikania micrantha]